MISLNSKTNEKLPLLEEYFYCAAEEMMRPAAGCLRHPYLVPGGLYHDELWDWDCFWASKGLFALFSARGGEKAAAFLAHAEGSWRNFLENQSANGAIPILIKAGNRDFFGCTTGDGKFNQAKPILGQFALEIAGATGSYAWIAPYFDGLLKFYSQWSKRYGTKCGLLVWGSDVAIGVDSDPTSYGRPPFSSANLLLNCLFHQDLHAASRIAAELGRQDDSGKLAALADGIEAAIQRECWDPQDEFFYTVDVQSDDHRDENLPGLNKGMPMSWRTLPLKVKMFTGFLPMWCGIATREQADRLVRKHLLNSEEFSAPWGIRTLSRNERMYEPDTNSANPSNWLGPIWIVANYMIYEGLLRYGFQREANVLAKKTIDLLARDLSATSTLHECYHPHTGKPNFNSGFISWNTLALLMSPSE